CAKLRYYGTPAWFAYW
nr:immunoglobulin heavy chain junction region [Mus musculus]